MSRKVRYIEVRQSNQVFIFEIARIQYRDSKGRLSKFSSRKKLSVHVIGKKEKIDKKTKKTVLREFEVRSYKLKLAKRKKPTTIESAKKRVWKRAMKYKKSLVLIQEGSITRFMYMTKEQSKKKGSKKKGSKKKGSKKKGSKK